MLFIHHFLESRTLCLGPECTAFWRCIDSIM